MIGQRRPYAASRRNPGSGGRHLAHLCALSKIVWRRGSPPPDGDDFFTYMTDVFVAGQGVLAGRKCNAMVHPNSPVFEAGLDYGYSVSLEIDEPLYTGYFLLLPPPDHAPGWDPFILEPNARLLQGWDTPEEARDKANSVMSGGDLCGIDCWEMPHMLWCPLPEIACAADRMILKNTFLLRSRDASVVA